MQFFEDFSSGQNLCGVRLQCGWSGEVNAGSLFNDSANDWRADHGNDPATPHDDCMDPNNTSRVIHLPSGESAAAHVQAAAAAMFTCVPANDPGKAHMMTTVNTEGYVTLWFSPNQTFRNVNRVCWDQNVTWEGGGRWVIVNFLTAAEYAGETDLGYTSTDFPDGPNLASSPQGEARNGVKVFAGGMSSYTDGSSLRSGPGGPGSQENPVTDKAPRYQHCVIDNNNGTVTMTKVLPNGAVASGTVAGGIPNGDIRVEFADDAYNPDKHFFSPERNVPRDSTGLYTWHWDNLTIE